MLLIITKRWILRLYKHPTWWWLSKDLRPLSRFYGYDRGYPIDRYYIENFLESHKQLIQGRCLELLDREYTIRFGGNRVKQSEVLDIDANNSRATIISNIKNLTTIPDNQFDCIILTQVLQFIDEPQIAIAECSRVLKPGGVLLATVPTLSRIDCVSGIDGDYWRFTAAGAKHLFAKYFPENKLDIKSWGNAKIGAKFIAGLALAEVSKYELDYNDKDFPCIVTIRAIK